MALSTYSDLTGAVASWLHRSDLTSIIPDFVRLGEMRIYREVRCKAMEKALSVALVSGVATVPSDYLELKFSYLDGTPIKPLTGASAPQLYAKYPLRSGSGEPVMIARDGSNFVFGPFPGTGYTVKGIYYAQPTAIETAVDTLFTKSPDLYLFAALCESAPYTKSPDVQLWETKYQNIINQLNVQDAGENASGSCMRVTAS